MICLAGLAVAGNYLARAEDADRFRLYFKFYDGDVEPLWGVKDHWSLGLGANLNRYVGTEFAFDYYVRDWGQTEAVGQASIYNFVPELRLRYPLLKDRLVPYFLAGFGPSWIQSKDVNAWAFNLDPKAQGWSYTAAVGGGLEYFLRDNIALGVEGRYYFVHSIDGTVGGQPVPVDLSAALFTFGLRVYFDENHPRPLVSEDLSPTSRLYFGVRAGVNFITDGELSSGVTLQPKQSAWGGVASQTGGLLLGVDWGRNFGVEIAGDSINHVINVDGLGIVSEYGQGWVTANLRLRMPRGRWCPYIYAGPGICYTEVKEDKPAALGLNLSGSKLSPAVNIGAGIEYFITRNFSVHADARWAYSWDHTFTIESLLSAKGDISYAAATIGFRVYLFDL